MTYLDRRQAGAVLGRDPQLASINPESAVILGLARGGVPVAAEVGRALGIPFDAIIVRKIGAPFDPEYAIGAIAEGGEPLFGSDAKCGRFRDEASLAIEIARLRTEIDRQRALYRHGRGLPNLTGVDVVLVDDGIATGLTMRAAIATVRSAGARAVLVAVPVGPPAAIRSLRSLADDVVCPLQPVEFRAVGNYYEDFAPTSDSEVQALLTARR